MFHRRLFAFTLALLLPFTAFAEGRLLVTEDFVAKKHLEVPVSFEDKSVLSTLRDHAKVHSTAGGSFVTQIAGVPAKQNDGKQWFYYVNGVLADVSAASYKPMTNDTVVWDYHPWTKETFLSGMIGAYPEPFANGYGGKRPGTLIVFQREFRVPAIELQLSMSDRGVREVMTKFLPDTIGDYTHSYYIYVGPWEKLLKRKRIRNFLAEPAKVGLFVEVEGNTVHALDWNRKRVSAWKDAGFIVALNSAFSTKPFWFVSGVSEESVKRAVKLLSENPERISGYAGAIVMEKQLVHVPVVQ